MSPITKYELLINKSDIGNANLNELIEKILRFGHRVGIDNKNIFKVKIRQIFGEGIKIDIEATHHWKII